MRLIAVLILAVAAPAAVACTTAEPAVAWSCHELSFESSVAYAHPINDVSVQATFTMEGREAITVLGFWDGGRTYRIRAALPASGEWRYDVTSSDPSNGIQAAGMLEVVETTESDPFLTHGWPRVSDDRRSLTYADGTPFFYLGDSAWEMAWASTEGQVETYLADRQEKEFNVVHMVTNTHQMFHPWHITNLDGNGDRYLLNSDRTMLNPAYFDRLDWIVEQSAAAGFAVGFVPIWGTFGEPHRNDPDALHSQYYSQEEALTHARYVGARYAGHNVIWMVGGDRVYDTEEKRAYWSAFARELRRASGSAHLMSAYSGGYSGSFTSWPSPPEWLDFHMYVASHFAEMRYLTDENGNRKEDQYGSLIADGGYHWLGGLQGYAQEDYRPVLSIESNFEDLPGRFWEFVAEPGGVRITDADVRQAAYSGLLSGSTVGYNYGANGIWSWSNRIDPGTNGGFQFRYTALEALDLPGSSQMASLRSFAEAHEWYTWVPRPDLIREVDTDDFVAASAWDTTLVVYCPEGTRSFSLQMPRAEPGPLELEWTHPVTGETIQAEALYTGGTALIRPPSESDWLLLARSAAGTRSAPPPAAQVMMKVSGANPGRSIRLSAQAATVTHAEFTVSDVLGRQIQSETLALSSDWTPLVVTGVAPGVYSCRLVWADAQGQQQIVQKTVTVAR